MRCGVTASIPLPEPWIITSRDCEANWRGTPHILLIFERYRVLATSLSCRMANRQGLATSRLRGARRARSQVNGEGNRIRVLPAAHSDVAVSNGARNRGRAPLRRTKDEDQHGAGRRNVKGRDCRYKLTSANECRHAKGTIPTHDGVPTKVTSVDCQ